MPALLHQKLQRNFMADLKTRAQELVLNGLKGLGEKKLTDLETDLLKEVVNQLGCETPDDATVESIVKILLKKKRAKEIQLPNVPTPEPKPKQDAQISVFKRMASLEIIAFNSLKLRVFRDELKDKFKQLVERFSHADVIVMSEVSNVDRAKEFLAYLNSYGEWAMQASHPSKPANEMHIVFHKSAIDVIRHVTTVSVGVHDFSHAPFTILLQDRHLGRFVVTSVHFPPESKSSLRDRQIKAFLAAYREESAVRCDTPITDKGAKDARTQLPIHIIAGDFNCWIGNECYNVDKYGFEAVLGKHVPTTSGMRSFDNFLVTQNARSACTISSSVLELEVPQKSCKGQIGLSDHSPISLRLERSFTTSTRASAHA